MVKLVETERMRLARVGSEGNGNCFSENSVLVGEYKKASEMGRRVTMAAQQCAGAEYCQAVH